MYKTVRKGDASLQYTILPQTDQCPSSGFPQASSKPRPQVIKYTMAAVLILIIFSCVATPFLMNQNDHNLFASTVFAMGRVGHNNVARNNTRSQAKDIAAGKARSRITIATSSTTETAREKEHQDSTSTTTSLFKQDGVQELTSAEPSLSTTEHPEDSTDASTKSRQLTSTPSTSVPASTGSPTPASLRITTNGSVEGENPRTSTASSPRAKSKMPRVTLKLRGNETIPQMYLSGGMTSYKKGNITTSVVAHNLSLLGVVIKTPEGTIKPWYFTDPASELQWKGTAQMPLTIYVVLTGLACLAIVSIILTLYVQRKASRKQRQSVEEPESGNQEEDTSTLLGCESQETEEKE